MKIITLNTWAGKIDMPFLSFIRNQENHVDVFCLQEVFNASGRSTGEYTNSDDGNTNLLQDLREMLPGFKDYFCAIDDSGVYGIATFVRKGVDVIASGEIVLYENLSYDPADDLNDHTRKMQWLRLKDREGEWLVMNVHGHWNPVGKGDIPERIEQSRKIISFAGSASLPKIILGDFNLDLNTESVRMIEDAGFTNLVREGDIKTTRTSLYTGSVPYADYVFVSPEVNVNAFEVMTEEVSDHSALFVEVSANEKTA